MKQDYFNVKSRQTFYFVFIAVAIVWMVSCKNATDKRVKIVTDAMDFQLIDSIPSGWHSFDYENKSGETHFFLLEKYPPGKTIENARTEVVPVFQKGMDRINEGKPDSANAEFGNLPPWFSDIVFTGGSGLISPGLTAHTTLNLSPGYYVMECYVKMPSGVFHSAMGMITSLVVTNKDSGNPEPTADVAITISGTEGIVFTGPLQKGETTFSVFYKDQKVHENFVGHDVNLVKLDENADLLQLEKWMNWADPKGLITPAPQAVTFLGGVNDLPAGSTGYFTADLEPGQYAFISEVPGTTQKGLLKTFTVAD